MIIDRIRTEIASFSSKEKLFLFAAMLCSFFISADYAIIRPVSNSLFIQSYGAKAFPYAWLLSIPFNLAVVALYNKYLTKLGCFKIFVVIAGVVTLGNCMAATQISSHKALPFLFYAWKDVYVMLMFQLLWSVIHSTVELGRARYLYGLLFGIGAIGGLCGSLVPGFLAVKMGSESLLFSTLPLYLVLGMSYHLLIKNSGSIDKKVDEGMNKSSSLKESFKLIANSKLLLAILCMVTFMQVTATITDFQFNSYLEKLYPEKDLRTQYFGRLLSFGNLLTMSFQFIGIYVFIRFMGKFKTHLMVPAVLCLNGLAFALYPVFGVISYAFLTIKCFDFSLFNVIKEMLYIPLKTEEKFRAKALIDVFMYRGAKVFASFFVLFLQLFFANSVVSLLSWVNVAIFVIWCYVVASIKEHYSQELKAAKSLA